MGKKIAIYLLGISMGMIIMLFFLSFFDSSKNQQVLIDKLKKDNKSLIEQTTEINIKYNELLIKYEKLNNDKSNEENESNKEELSKKVISISNKDTHETISKKLIDEGIYPYKNDLLLILEMLEYDKYEAEKILSDYGIFSQNVNLLNLNENDSIKISNILYDENLIKDKTAFRKLQLILNSKSKIIYGEKIFKKNSSLREIIDVLMSEE